MTYSRGQYSLTGSNFVRHNQPASIDLHHHPAASTPRQETADPRQMLRVVGSGDDAVAANA
jgi:hypothetical protein